MAIQTQTTAHNVLAAFECDSFGVSISFDDPAYVCADAILIDPGRYSVHAVLHEAEWLVGHVSPAILKAFQVHGKARLSAVRPDGSVLTLQAPVTSRH